MIGWIYNIYILYIQQGYDAIAALLIKNGADINAQSSSTTRMKPIHLACYNGRTAVVRLLLSHGCDSQAKDSCGFTPLQTALQHGQSEVVKLLFEEKKLGREEYKEWWDDYVKATEASVKGGI